MLIGSDNLGLDPARGEEFVGRLAAAFESPIVVDDDESFGDDVVVKIFDADLG
jgi:hypothetical protein